MGIETPRETSKLPKEVPKIHKDPPVPLNKVGKYCEGEDGNTTLPVELNNMKHTDILDSGAGIAIATKRTWESWDRPALRRTRIKL